MNKKKIVILLIVILISGSYIGYVNSFKPVKVNNPEEVEIIIPEGSSVKEVGKILKDNNIIRSGMAFKSKLRKRDDLEGLKAGEYYLTPGSQLDKVIDTLLKGSKNRNVKKFTIPEGYEIRQIADRLSDKGLIDKEVFLDLTSNKSNFQEEFSFLNKLEKDQGLEGFLFPATYEIFEYESEEDIIRRMLRAFENIYNNELKDKLPDSKLDLNQIITLASIIEREAKIDEERPVMSGVFYNRIEENMRLGSCATVQYILGERKPRLSIADTKIKSPYNTYINSGLPPAPIAAPGKLSIISAIEPADTEYLYFTLKSKSGNHEFTKTYEEHKKATNKYREFLDTEEGY